MGEKKTYEYEVRNQIERIITFNRRERLDLEVTTVPRKPYSK